MEKSFVFYWIERKT